MFVVIDGIDGSGKGTQLAWVEQALIAEGKTVCILDFPRYEYESSFAVKKYLNGNYGKTLSAKQKSLFFAIDRFDALHDFWEKLQEYDYVISNRYVSANMIHQWWLMSDATERKKFLDWVEDLEYNIFKIPKPDMTIFLNVTPETSNKLVEKKEKREYIENQQNKDINEADAEHMKNAYEAANLIVDLYPDWIKIDCEKNWEILAKEEITQIILKTIKK